MRLGQNWAGSKRNKEKGKEEEEVRAKGEGKMIGEGGVEWRRYWMARR